MTTLTPTDPDLLATAVVTTLAVHFDPQAREASIFYWERGLPYRQDVLEAAERTGDKSVIGRVGELKSRPADPALHLALHARLVELAAAGGGPALDTLFARGWAAESNSRLGYHLGRHYDGTSQAVIVPERLRTLATGEELAPGDTPRVRVIVPFRDRGPGMRLRNLLACLLALRDQSVPRSFYQVVVVETDDEPRWRDSIKPRADHYLFAHKPGDFNKSWAVNVGAVNAPGQTEILCVLDADALVDHDFIARNVARFHHPGTMGHLSYRDMWCLDESATSWAIEERLWGRAPQVDAQHLRAFVLRRPPGCCVWARTSAFQRIGGMDERFEGWGGEDNDFAYRMDINSAFDHYHDPLLHMYHPSSAVLREDGELVNAHIPALSWGPSAEPIGDLHRFTRPTGAGSQHAPHERRADSHVA
ncbi:galactosyltransferase-related protein [Streptomyces sp. BK205]|uniref:glycosyltransferase n=1 Tax=Streptomyces sp. BK205 TaxID=2512164 RepID=UPI001046D992|nr:galactosyltransferase-related protein [Streptomyces sp. BK205]TCR15998.1 galactosyltransferase-like protein [Streptomyces sp. BK205]